MKQIMEVKRPCGNVLKRGKQMGSEGPEQKERQTAIITMIELGLTKEQILTKYSEEDYSKAEEALNNR